MAAGDNRLGVIFEIAADPSKAESALSEFAGRANAVEADLAAAKKSLAQNQKQYNEALREGDTASKEIVADMARERGNPWQWRTRITASGILARKLGRGLFRRLGEQRFGPAARSGRQSADGSEKRESHDFHHGRSGSRAVAGEHA